MGMGWETRSEGHQFLDYIHSLTNSSSRTVLSAHQCHPTQPVKHTTNNSASIIIATVDAAIELRTVSR